MTLTAISSLESARREFFMYSTFDSYCLDMMYVEFMKNFLLADSSELMAVRVISDYSARKRFIPTF